MHTHKLRLRIQRVEANNQCLLALRERIALLAVVKGEHVPEHLDFSGMKEWPEDLWILDSPIAKTAKMADHFQFLADILEKNEESFHYLKSLGALIQLLGSITTDEFTTLLPIPSSIMVICGRIGIHLGVTIVNLKGVPQTV